MKVLYISSTKSGMFDQGIYFDLMQEFVKNGHEVYCVYANEKRFNEETAVIREQNIIYLGVKTGNLTKNPNLISKGIATLKIDGQFKKAINKNFGEIHFDLVLVSTPPITFTKTLAYLKKKDSIIYLMLKDIFPQNAVDLKMFKENGVVHRIFMKKEVASYQIANVIGCMSQANIDYMLNHFPQFRDKTRLLPNAINVSRENQHKLEKEDYGLSEHDIILLYGGNIGLPQGPDFIIQCMKELEKLDQVKLVIAGSGSHANQIEEAIISNSMKNSIYMNHLPVQEYNNLTAVCDIGLIFLDVRFTIPNFPQRLLSYLKESKPVICATDNATDIGRIAEDFAFGVSVQSNDVSAWIKAVKRLCNDPELRHTMGKHGLEYLMNNYDVAIAYSLIMQQLKEKNYV